MALVVPLVLSLLKRSVLSAAAFPPTLQPLFTLFRGLPRSCHTLTVIKILVLTLLLGGLTFCNKTIISGLLDHSCICGLQGSKLQLLLSISLSCRTGIHLNSLVGGLGARIGQITVTIHALSHVTALLVAVLIFLKVLITVS